MTTFGFTFQYGQIYYQGINAGIDGIKNYLHSNMVRFIIVNLGGITINAGIFTFQYGQIYYNI